MTMMIETSKRTVATELTNAAIFCLSELILADSRARTREKERADVEFSVRWNRIWFDRFAVSPFYRPRPLLAQTERTYA